MSDSKELTKAKNKAKRDFENDRKPHIEHADSGVRKLYFDTYYDLRTNSKYKHVIAKYGPFK